MAESRSSPTSERSSGWLSSIAPSVSSKPPSQLFSLQVQVHYPRVWSRHLGLSHTAIWHLGCRPRGGIEECDYAYLLRQHCSEETSLPPACGNQHALACERDERGSGSSLVLPRKRLPVEHVARRRTCMGVGARCRGCCAVGGMVDGGSGSHALGSTLRGPHQVHASFGPGLATHWPPSWTCADSRPTHGLQQRLQHAGREEPLHPASPAGGRDQVPEARPLAA